MAAGASDLGRRGLLLWYGFGALKTAFSQSLELANAEVMQQGRWKIIITMLAVTGLTRTFIWTPLWC
nr:Arginine exporter protein ArgO [Klebsiella pneumoniae]